MGGFFGKLWDDFTGKSAAKEASKAQQAALGATQAQADWEKQQAERLNKMQDQSWNQAGEQISTALPQAQTWLKDYFDYLQTAPDTAYNASRGQMERGLSDAANNVAAAARSRGIANSGIALGGLRDLAVQRARGLGQLESQRSDRRGQSLSAGTQLAQNWLNQWLNQHNAASNMAQVNNTQVPQLQMKYAQMLGQNADQPSPLGQVARQLAGAWVNKQFAPANQTSTTGQTTGSANQTSTTGQTTGSANPFFSFLNPSTYTSGGSNLLGSALKFFL